MSSPLSTAIRSPPMINSRGTETLYEQILDTAMAVLHSDFASIQMFYPERGTNGELDHTVVLLCLPRWGCGRPDCITFYRGRRMGRRSVVPARTAFHVSKRGPDGHSSRRRNPLAGKRHAAGFAIRRLLAVHVLASFASMKSALAISALDVLREWR